MLKIVKRGDVVPHPILSMKFNEIFRKSKFDPYLYSLKFLSDFDTDYVSYLRVGCG